MNVRKLEDDSLSKMSGVQHKKQQEQKSSLLEHFQDLIDKSGK
jgi:hypothetical protein